LIFVLLLFFDFDFALPRGWLAWPGGTEDRAVFLRGLEPTGQDKRWVGNTIKLCCTFFAAAFMER